LTETTGSGGYRVYDHVVRLLDGPAIWAPAIDGAVVLSLRGGDFEIVVGQDISIGYLDHTTESVRLYLQESFTFRVHTGEAAVPLVYAASGRRSAAGGDSDPPHFKRGRRMPAGAAWGRRIPRFRPSSAFFDRRQLRHFARLDLMAPARSDRARLPLRGGRDGSTGTPKVRPNDRSTKDGLFEISRFPAAFTSARRLLACRRSRQSSRCRSASDLAATAPFATPDPRAWPATLLPVSPATSRAPYEYRRAADTALSWLGGGSMTPPDLPRVSGVGALPGLFGTTSGGSMESPRSSAKRSTRPRQESAAGETPVQPAAITAPAARGSRNAYGAL
jgi:hypothetical protein